MKKALVLACLIALTLIGVSPVSGQNEISLPLVPLPAEISAKGGTLILKDTTIISLPDDAGEVLKATAAIFAEKAARRYGTSFELKANGPCDAEVLVGERAVECGEAERPSEWQSDEAYTLRVSERVVLMAGNPHGFHNGFATLLQLLNDSGEIPKVEIKDSPRFGWRGMLLDSSRSFLPTDVIKRYIDILSELKINRFHWHIVDDQGWRIESQVYPRLHQVGGIVSNMNDKKLKSLAEVQFDEHGRRMESPRYSSIEEAASSRGYYTQEELREIVEYAKARHVMVVPEIDIPGHSSAMLAAYPELSCSGEPVPVRQGPGIYATALCPAKEEVYEFLDNLFAEIADIFPAPYVHIGSDEVLATDWLDYPGNRKLMEEYGYEDKHDLQAHFVRRVDKILEKHNRTMIAWDEITHYAPDGVIIQAWRKHEYARIAAEDGHDSVISPVTHCYIDYPQLSFTLKNLYGFEPIPEGLDSSLHHHILGGEVNLWGERVTLANIDSKAFPRVIAHSEVMWSQKEDRDWDNFTDRLDRLQKDMERRGVDFGTTWRDILLLP